MGNYHEKENLSLQKTLYKLTFGNKTRQTFLAYLIMMNIFKKTLLLTCIAIWATQISSWSQSIAESNYVCTGTGTVTLSVSPNTGIVMTSYIWKNTVTNATVSTTATAVVPGGSYSVTYSTALGPRPALNIVVQNIVPSTPTIMPTTVTTPICGTATQLLTSSTSPNYSWKRNGVAITGTTNAITATGSDVSIPGTYNYTVSTTNVSSNCTVTSTAVALKLSPVLPVPTISSANSNVLLCGSSTQTLSASGGGASYIWKRGTTVLPSTTGNSLVVAGTDAVGTFLYTAALDNAAGCPLNFSTTGITLTLAPASAAPTILPATLTTPICGTSTQVLSTTSVAGATYFWKRDGIAITGSTNSITVTGTDVSTPGTYNYTVAVQNSGGCLSSDATAVVLKVSPKPATPSINPASFNPNVVCGTDFKTLTATSGGSKYNWKRNATLVTSSTANNTLNVAGVDINTGGIYTYTVNLENSVGCISDDSPVGVVLQLFPTVPAKPTVTTNGAITFCEGNTVRLNSSYNVSTGFNVWSKTIGTTTQADTTTTAADGVTVRSVGTNTYTVKAKDLNGCTSLSSNSIVVTVNALPSKPLLNKTGSIEICDLDSTILSATNNYTGGSYSWKNGNTSISTRTNLTVKTAGSYTLVFTEGVNQCTSLPSLITVLSVNLLPAKPTIANLRPTEFCFRDFTTLKASASNNPAAVSGYEWDYNGLKTQEITVTTSTKKTVDDVLKVSVKSVSDRGCKSKDASDFATIIVLPLPTTPTISNLDPLTVCPDSVVRLVSSASPSTSYIWTIVKDKFVFGDKQNVFINVTGKYYVQTVSLKNCASDPSTEVSVTIREAPQPASILASPISATVCKGGKVTLKTLVANGNIARYYWRDEKTQKEVAITQDIEVDTSGSFSVRIRDVFGCFATNSKPVNVNISPLPVKPTISIIKSKIFCDEDSTIVQASLASTTPNGNKTIYRWIVDGTDIIESTNRQFAWKKASSIAVAVTDSNGCKATVISDTIRTTVNPLPDSPSITVRGAIPFCANKNVTLSAVATTGVTYKWSTGATTQNITTNTAGSITAQAVNGFGCLSKPSQVIQVRVNPLPITPRLTANGETTFCDGSRVRLVSSSPLKSYWWRSTTDSIGTGDDLTSLFVAKTGNYFTKVEDANGCISLASTPIAVDSRPNPTPTIIKKIGTFSLDAQGLGDENGYIWRYNGDVQKDLTTRIIKARKDGDYQVQASISYNIPSLSGGKLVCYSKTSGALKYEQDVTFEGFSVFPNPTINGEINVEVIEDFNNATIIVYDLYGQLISERKVDKFNKIESILLPNYHGNTYFVKVITDGFERVKKVITLRN